MASLVRIAVQNGQEIIFDVISTIESLSDEFSSGMSIVDHILLEPEDVGKILQILEKAQETAQENKKLEERIEELASQLEECTEEIAEITEQLE